jgi:hypothetical protein
MAQQTIPGWVALGIIGLILAGGLVGGYLLTWETETEAVVLRHPQSGHVIQCGPYKYETGFGKPFRRERSYAAGMLRRCLDHNLKGGYQRVAG